MYKRPGFLAVAGLVLAFTGCGKSTATVSGKVTLDGKALKSGSVTMVGEDKLPLSAPIQDGTYKIEKVPYGTVQVAVVSPDPQESGLTPEKVAAMAKYGRKLPNVPTQPAEIKGWFPIPSGYGDVGRSGLSLTVSEPETSFDIPLTAVGKAP
jgi:hypothetical protein